MDVVVSYQAWGTWEFTLSNLTQGIVVGYVFEVEWLGVMHLMFIFIISAGLVQIIQLL